MTHHFQNISDSGSTERTSLFPSRGSITIETALAAPLFFLAVWCMVFLLELLATQTAVAQALKSAGREWALEEGLGFCSEKLEEDLIQILGRSFLDQSYVVEGADGLDCGNSTYRWAAGTYELSVQYWMEPPIPVFSLPRIGCEESCRIKAWNGYRMGLDLPDGGKIVYVTEYGLVYHETLDCTYLNPSVKPVLAEAVEMLRNEAGGKYYPCETCRTKNGEGGVVYVTDYGTRYHRTLQCSQIKRSIRAVPLEEINGLGGCTKCVES